MHVTYYMSKNSAKTHCDIEPNIFTNYYLNNKHLNFIVNQLDTFPGGGGGILS